MSRFSLGIFAALTAAGIMWPATDATAQAVEGQVPRETEPTGNWEESLAAFLKATMALPDSPQKYARLQTLLAPFPSYQNEAFARLRPLVTQAAEFGVPAAMTVLGIYLTPTDTSAAFNWYSLAAQQGYVPAVARLGVMLCSSPVPGTPDLKKAVECFEFAVERGDVVAKASLGECYLTGKGVAKDRDRAIQLLREASDGGNPIAMNRLGDVLRFMGVEAGRRGEPSAAFYTEALQLFAKASKLGNLDALGNLGIMHINGEGVSADPKWAANLFEQGALAGNPSCMFLYARCLESGVGAPKNTADAKTWLRKAAEGGHPPAQQWYRKNGAPVPAP